MTTAPDGFVTVRNVAKYFQTSRSTIDRRRLKAQQGSDESVLKHFILRTRDGLIHESPTRDEVNRLIKEGMVPEWFVNKTWLLKEYGKREAGEKVAGKDGTTDDKPAAAVDGSAITALKQQYEERIGDLKQELQNVREDNRLLLEYAQKDKQLFGNAVSSLTKVLVLPGMAHAIDTANRQIAESTETAAETENRGVQERKPDVQPVQKPKSAAEKPTLQRKRWFSWRRS